MSGLQKIALIFLFSNFLNFWSTQLNPIDRGKLAVETETESVSGEIFIADVWMILYVSDTEPADVGGPGGGRDKPGGRGT